MGGVIEKVKGVCVCARGCNRFASYLTLQEAGRRDLSSYQQRMRYVCGNAKTDARTTNKNTATRQLIYLEQLKI